MFYISCNIVVLYVIRVTHVYFCVYTSYYRIKNDLRDKGGYNFHFYTINFGDCFISTLPYLFFFIDTKNYHNNDATLKKYWYTLVNKIFIHIVTKSLSFMIKSFKNYLELLIQLSELYI